MIKKLIKKHVDHVLRGSEKDQRISELWHALNHAYSTIRVFGQAVDYEANPEWEPPVYLRNGPYTMDDRLSDIREHSKKLMQCEEEIKKVLFK